jgi:hypothetical protein
MKNRLFITAALVTLTIATGIALAAGNKTEDTATKPEPVAVTQENNKDQATTDQNKVEKPKGSKQAIEGC